MSKFHMFSNGKVVVEANKGFRPATAEETAKHIATLVPQNKKWEGKAGTLEAVKFDNGSLKARYAFTDENGKTFRKAFKKAYKASHKVEAQNSATPNQTEPLQSGDKAKPDVKVPRKKEVGLSQHDGKDAVKVRKEEYTPGKEQGHTDVVPRSKSNSGLKGSESTKFDDVGKTESGNSDSYVQDFTPSDKGSSAGSVDNHAVASNGDVVKEANNDEIPANIFIKDENTTNTEKAETNFVKAIEVNPVKNIEKSESSKATQVTEADEESVIQTSKLKKQLHDATALLKERTETLKKARTETNKFKIREARMDKAIEYVLTLQTMNPEKYAEANTFVEKVNDSVKKMSPELLETGIAQMKQANQTFAEAMKSIPSKVASSNQKDGAGLQQPIVIAHHNTSKQDTADRLKEILMSGTSLGRKMAEYENYVPHTKE